MNLSETNKVLADVKSPQGKYVICIYGQCGPMMWSDPDIYFNVRKVGRNLSVRKVNIFTGRMSSNNGDFLRCAIYYGEPIDIIWRDNEKEVEMDFPWFVGIFPPLEKKYCLQKYYS